MNPILKALLKICTTKNLFKHYNCIYLACFHILFGEPAFFPLIREMALIGWIKAGSSECHFFYGQALAQPELLIGWPKLEKKL